MIWSGWEPYPVDVRDADLRPRGEDAEWRQGMHLGQVIHRIKVALGENVGDVAGDQPYVRMQEGFLWETALEYVAAGMSLDEALELAFKRYMVEVRKGVVKQIQVVRDGIKMTPDGFNPTLGELESYKRTSKSLGNAKTQAEFESNFWPWLMQEKGYCWGLGVDTVRWVVLWAAGDYKRGPGTGPVMLQSVGVFAPDELATNWKTVLSHARGMSR